MKHLRKYIFFVLMCLMCFEAKAVSPLQPLKLIHYDGCVNIGVPDTLLLRVDDAAPNLETKGYYVWSIPDTWKPIGCVTCKELKVVTYETEAVTRVYRVGTHRSSGMEYAFDTVQVRGADTTLIILDDGFSYSAEPRTVDYVDQDAFDFLWYKGYLHPDSLLSGDVLEYKYRFNGIPPILAYRPKAGCWSVSDKVVKWGLVSMELQGHGSVRVNSGITYCEVNTQGKTEQQIGRSEVLHFEVRPAAGYYLDRVEIGNGEQMRVVSECDIEEKDGVFSFREFPIWDYATATEWNFFTTEDYRIILKEGEKKDNPVCDDPVALVHYDGCVNIGVPDTLLLRVENPVEGAAYRWQIPSEWKPIGCTTCAELKVETMEKTAATRIYGVSLSGAGFAMDTIQVKGADTALLIMYNTIYHVINTGRLPVVTDHFYFDFVWYKGNLTEENWIVNNSTYVLWSQLGGQKPLLKYRVKGNNTCWSVTDEVVVFDSVYPISLAHYDGCVNIGVSDTLLLKIENADARLRYRWRIPDVWEPIGETDRGELRVITHETQNTTRIYSVSYANIGPSVYDTVQVKGADTKLLIFDLSGLDMYTPMREDFDWVDDNAFTYAWYKTALSPDNFVEPYEMVAKYLFKGEPPVLAYRYNEGCWSVTDDVIHYKGIVKVEIVGNGKVRVYSSKMHGDVTSEGNHEVFADDVDTLRFVAKPSKGFDFEGIEIEYDEQVTVVPEQEIKKEADGTFSFRSSVTWQELEGYIDSISKENFRFVFVEKQHTIKDLGEATVCRGDSVKMGSRYVWTPGFHYDTVDGEMAKADTVYQLYLHVNPTYHDTLHFLVERDSMPYILGKDTIRNFGWTRLNALTVNGCDSITYVRLDTLYIHREQHFYDTLQACGEAVLSWRGKEITQTGDYPDTVFDPYKGGTDSIYHLRADIYPTYQETLHFSTEPDSLPYIYGKDTIRQFGLTELHRYQTVHGCDSIIYVRLDTLYVHRERHFYDTLRACGEAVLSWRGREITQTGDYADTVVDPYRGGTDSIHHLRADIYPTYQETLHFSIEPDSLPYIYGKDTIRQFGLTELHRYQTVHGCDSITYVQLDTLYVHRERHFYDTLQACGEAVLSWRGREITQTGDYADTVVDPYRGGTDSIHHLRADIYPTYHETYTDSCYIEQLPYTVGGRPMQDFGEQTEQYVTVAGCDSVREYSLSRRWHHYYVSVRVKGEGSANVTDTVLREDGTLWLAFMASACHRLDSLRIDGRNEPPQSRYLLQNLHGNCEVEAVFGSAVPQESVLRREACRDSLPIVYNGETYGEGEHTIVLRSVAGCDSVVRLFVQGKENVARIAVTDTISPPCGAEEITFSYRTEAGSPRLLRLAFDPVAEKAGFRDTVLAASTGKQTVRIALPPSAAPDRYGLRLWQTDISGCSAAVEDMVFEIPYPSTIIVQKWSDVLAVLSAEYNGGYEFSGYQWYKNGEAIAGATRPYYQAKPYLRSTDTYAVLLERASDGLRLQSCGVKRKSYPKELVLELLPNPTASGEAVTVRVGGKPDAEGIIEVFDGIGKPVYERPFRESHILPAHWQPGTYVVRVRNAKSTWMATGKLIVR